MTENRIGFLCNIASTLSPNHETHKLLMSYYLMQCTRVTQGYGLPAKYFSTKARCPCCCLEWARDTEVKVRPVKLSKKQRQRKRLQIKSELNKDNFEKNRARNEMEQVCTFCKQSTTTKLTKPKMDYIKLQPLKEENIILKDKKKEVIIKTQKKAVINKTGMTKTETKKNTVVNVYSNAFDVFSLKNEKNTLSSAIKDSTKVIKNNKKKKEKFAGLCQKAVLASAKFKDQKETQKPQTLQNKLNLFLKPSSG